MGEPAIRDPRMTSKRFAYVTPGKAELCCSNGHETHLAALQCAIEQRKDLAKAEELAMRTRGGH